MSDQLLEAWKAEYSPKKVKVKDLVLDGDLAVRLQEAQEKLESYNGKAPPKTLKELVSSLRAEAEPKMHTLVFKSIGKKAWQDLKAEAPPDDDQRSRGMEWDPEAMMIPAAVACCCEIDGEKAEMSQEFAEWLFSNINDEDRLRIYSACYDANEFGVKIPKAVTDNHRRGAKR